MVNGQWKIEHGNWMPDIVHAQQDESIWKFILHIAGSESQTNDQRQSYNID
jgi:hypothetical protein